MALCRGDVPSAMPAGFAISTHSWKPAPLVYKANSTVLDPKAKLKKTFRDLDANHDGRLTFNELKRLLQKGQPGMGDHEMRILFKHVDRDRSGLIEFDEFVDFIFSGALEDRREDGEELPQPVAGHRADGQPHATQQALQQALHPAAPTSTAPAGMLVAPTAPRPEQPTPAISSQPSRRASKDSSGPRRPPQLMSRTPSKEECAAGDSFGVTGRKADLHTPSESPAGVRGPQRSQPRGSAGLRAKESSSPAGSGSGGTRKSVVARRGPATRSQSPPARPLNRTH